MSLSSSAIIGSAAPSTLCAVLWYDVPGLLYNIAFVATSLMSSYECKQLYDMSSTAAYLRTYLEVLQVKILVPAQLLVNHPPAHRAFDNIKVVRDLLQRNWLSEDFHAISTKN